MNRLNLFVAFGLVVSSTTFATPPSAAPRPSASPTAQPSTGQVWWPTTNTSQEGSTKFEEDPNLLDSINLSFSKEVEIPISYKDLHITPSPSASLLAKTVIFCALETNRTDLRSKGVINPTRPLVTGKVAGATVFSNPSWLKWDSVGDLSSVQISALRFNLTDPRGKIIALTCQTNTAQSIKSSLQAIAEVLKDKGIVLKATYKKATIEEVHRPTDSLISVDPGSSAHGTN